MAVLLLVGLCMIESAFGAGDELEELLEQMARLEQRIEQRRQEQQLDQQQLQRASRTLRQIQEGLIQQQDSQSVSEQFFGARRHDLQEQLGQLGAEKSQVRRQLERSRQALRMTVAAAFAEQRFGGTDVLQLWTLAALARQRHDQTRVATRQLLRLEARQGELLSGEAHIETTEQRHTSFSELSIRQLRQRHKLLAGRVTDLQDQLADQQEQLQEMNRRRAQLEALLSRFEQQRQGANARQARADPVSASGSGGAEDSTMFNDGHADAAGEVNVAADGARRLFWRATPVGIRTPVAGRVIFAGAFAGYRHLLICDHGGGWRTLYGNMIECRVQEGQSVEAGQPLGQYQAGQGARAEPFWFEVRHQVTAVAPEKWDQLGEDWARRLFHQSNTQAGS